MLEQRRGRRRGFAFPHRGAQGVDRAQRLVAGRDHQARSHADPQRGDIAGLEAEIEMHVVDHGDQRVVGAFDAGGGLALGQGIEEVFGQVDMALQPFDGLRVAEIEVQPQIGRRGLVRRNGRIRQCRLTGQPVGGLTRVQLLRMARAQRIEEITADQPGFVAAIGGGDGRFGRCLLYTSDAADE